MSRPPSKPAQLSIRSFFQAKAPGCAPPPVPNNDSSRPAAQSSPPPPDASSDAASPPPAAPSPSPPSPSLPREASIRSITAADINPLRRLNALLLPVSYPDAFYRRAADPAAAGRFSRAVTWSHHGQDPKVVGGIVCRVEPDVDAMPPGSQLPRNLYVQSLCLLSPYRSMGLVAAALDTVVAAALADPSLHVGTVTAHVWTGNEEALRWYQARGFQRQEPAIKGYYLKLRPDSAWLVSRPVGASVRRALPSPSPTPPAPRPGLSAITAAVVNLPPMSSCPPAGNGSSSPARSSPRPPRPATRPSFQNQRPETEWNDLPADMAPPRNRASEPASGASSRSSSAARKKRDRAYPAAAYGS